MLPAIPGCFRSAPQSTSASIGALGSGRSDITATLLRYFVTAATVTPVAASIRAQNVVLTMRALPAIR